ncbi:MAG: 50S ribosomal protein L25/general stress protein Ctc [Cellulomonadaceae bacterium]|jgi:large subunit ribosomal protein L25|nr:50S ribosomal protein L25/general stress protein Ctc [Cellulomonadaceae bacterium]
MAEIKLAAETRTEFGKGAARRLRREAKVPAVVYGHGEDVLHVAINAHDTMLALRASNALFSLEIDGKPQLAVAKDVQRDPVRQIIEHVDFLAVKKGEKITVDVPVVVVGESYSGTIHVLEHPQLSVEAEATHLPQSVEVNIDGLEAGTVVTAADVKLPKGATLATDADVTIVLITEPKGETEATTDDDSDAAAEEAPAAE